MSPMTSRPRVRSTAKRQHAVIQTSLANLGQHNFGKSCIAAIADNAKVVVCMGGVRQGHHVPWSCTSPLCLPSDCSMTSSALLPPVGCRKRVLTVNSYLVHNHVMCSVSHVFRTGTVHRSCKIRLLSTAVAGDGCWICSCWCREDLAGLTQSTAIYTTPSPGLRPTVMCCRTVAQGM